MEKREAVKKTRRKWQQRKSNEPGTGWAIRWYFNRVSDKLQSILQAAGLKVATQKYEYTSAGITHQGENTYAIIHAPRGDATEAIVLVAPWLTADDELNLNGVTLALTLARYFKSEFRGRAPLVRLLTVDARMVIMV
jgi:Gaa1-like, GPI transamidase component.